MSQSLDRLKLLANAVFRQKNSLVWLVKFGVLFMIFLLFFIPAHRDLSILGSNMNSLKEQIADVKKISLNLLTPQELKETESNVQEFKSRLIDSSKASALLDFISDEADKNHFNVIQIFSDSPVTLKDEQGRELELDGKKLMLLAVNFRVETDFKSLGNFLKALKDDPKGNFVVESMALKKSSPEAESLQCDLTLSFVTV